MGEEYQRRIMVMGSVPGLGNVVMYDNMEDLFKWIKAGTGTEVVDKYGVKAFNGSYSLRVETRTTGATIGDWASGARYLYMLPAFRMSCEWLFCFDGYTNIDTVDMEAIYTDGSVYHYIGIRYDYPNKVWYYYGDGPGWVYVAGSSFYAQAGAWNRVKVEWNHDSGKYGVLRINNIEYDLSDKSYYEFALGGVSYLNFYFTVTTATAAPARVLFDEVLLLAE